MNCVSLTISNLSLYQFRNVNLNGCFSNSACPISCLSPNQTCRNFSCQCANGYTRDSNTLLCIKDQSPTLSSPCDSSPCFHDGICTVKADGFACQCKDGYIGECVLLSFSIVFFLLCLCSDGTNFIMLERFLVPYNEGKSGFIKIIFQRFEIKAETFLFYRNIDF